MLAKSFKPSDLWYANNINFADNWYCYLLGIAKAAEEDREQARKAKERADSADVSANECESRAQLAADKFLKQYQMLIARINCFQMKRVRGLTRFHHRRVISFALKQHCHLGFTLVTLLKNILLIGLFSNNDWNPWTLFVQLTRKFSDNWGTKVGFSIYTVYSLLLTWIGNGFHFKWIWNPQELRKQAKLGEAAETGVLDIRCWMEWTFFYLYHTVYCFLCNISWSRHLGYKCESLRLRAKNFTFAESFLNP